MKDMFGQILQVDDLILVQMGRNLEFAIVTEFRDNDYKGLELVYFNWVIRPNMWDVFASEGRGRMGAEKASTQILKITDYLQDVCASLEMQANVD